MIAPDKFRRVLGHFATGVTTVTGVDPVTGRPQGLTVNSFASVSLDPPLVSFCVRSASSTWPALRRAARLCVNILGAGQRDICGRMAAGGADRFHGLDWSLSPGGAPVLAGVVAWLEGTVEAEHEAGDHAIVVVRVRHLHEGGDVHPMVFLRGEYGHFAR
ncbi:flavin reductase family protein [Actinoplanes sp. RD1]|uniref:flavin reductase family protein n=1 Tax=Actinoplanes sp. RD1 TaxID=3064538 RepID=UPI00274265FA|nr:flavin reductase family protein [Actinoplanes sp. RD1]